MTADRRDNAVHLPINDILSSLKEQLAVQSNVVLMRSEERRVGKECRL